MITLIASRKLIAQLVFQTENSLFKITCYVWRSLDFVSQLYIRGNPLYH